MSHATNILAAAKAVGRAMLTDARDAVEVGVHDIDVLVRITGSLRVGEDYEQQLAAKADPWGLLAVALSKLNGVTLAALVREAQEAAPDNARAIKQRAQEALASVKAPTLSPCRGKVTTDLEIEIMGEDAA